MIFWLFASLFFVSLQGFYAGMETGMVSIMRPRAEHDARKHPGMSTRKMMFFLDHPGIMIATTLIGVNISVVMASISFKNFAECCGLSGGVGIIISSVLLSLLCLTAEIIPKDWFRESAYERCLAFIVPLYLTYCALWPVIRAFSWLTEWLNNCFTQQSGKTSAETVREDMSLFVRESEGYGTLDKATAAVLDRALTLPGLTLNDIAVPLEQFAVIPVDTTVQTAFDMTRNVAGGTLPVADRRGRILGTFDAYSAVLAMEESAWQRTPVAAVMAHAHSLPGESDIAAAVEVARKERVALFIVTGRNGEQTGILPPEKIAEMLFQ